MSKRSIAAWPQCVRILTSALVLGAVLMAGCVKESEEVLDTRYGKSRRAKTSINGTSLLVEKLRARGCEVDVKKKIAPSIERYDTVFWLPVGHGAPQPEAIDRVMKWFDNGYDRTFVYVDGGYDASFDYYRRVAEMTRGKEREEALRRLAEAKTERRDGYGEFSIFSFSQQRDDCEWYTNVSHGMTTSGQLSGPLAEGFGGQLPTVSYDWLIEPVDGYQTSRYYQQTDWEKTDLLSVDGEPFVSKLQADEYDTKRIFLISNGSLLVNYALVIPEKERMADRLLDRIAPSTNVLILESGPEDITVSDSDFENRNSWAWIAEAPLKYIVPHILFWGVIFCFVLFPIFGRPKNDEQESTTSFRSHVNAVGKQLGRAGRIQQARATIEHYQTQVADKGKPRN